MDILEWNDGYISFVFARTAINNKPAERTCQSILMNDAEEHKQVNLTNKRTALLTCDFA